MFSKPQSIVSISNPHSSFTIDSSGVANRVHARSAGCGSVCTTTQIVKLYFDFLKYTMKITIRSEAVGDACPKSIPCQITPFAGLS